MIQIGTKIIETSRLLLRPFSLEDCESMLKNWISDPNIQLEYGEPTYSSEGEVTKLLKGWIKQYEKLDFYRWAIIEKESNQNIGQIAFCKVYIDSKSAEIEYCIGEKFWGNGYALEALSNVIDIILANTGFEKLEAFHREVNLKSGRVLEKSIMRKTNNVERFIRENKLPYGEVCYAIRKCKK